MSDSEIDTRSRSSSPDPVVKAQKRKRPIVATEEELEIDVNLPEPPSKKAKRKEKKAKTKSTTTPTDTTATTADGGPAPRAIDAKPKTPAVPENPAEQKRSEHGIWIGNLPWSATKDAIRTFFLDYADIDSDSITRLHMPEPAPNRGPQRPGPKPQNKGFAYVDFKTAEDVVKAVGVSEKLMTGRAVLIKDAK
ncbi:Nucleolar protein 13, partial [Oleoguttula sp. CCFEE 5521]